jgi:hypothetical protein
MIENIYLFKNNVEILDSSLLNYVPVSSVDGCQHSK